MLKFLHVPSMGTIACSAMPDPSQLDHIATCACLLELALFRDLAPVLAVHTARKQHPMSLDISEQQSNTHMRKSPECMHLSTQAAVMSLKSGTSFPTPQQQ